MFHAKEYVKAGSLEEAYQLNQKNGNVLVGGMMWLARGRAEKAMAIDLSGLGLNEIKEDDDGFTIGCMCSLRQLEQHVGLNQYFNHVFQECTKHIVGVQFRNMATVGGSICGRYGFSDILTCMMMLDTTVELYRGGLIPLPEFSRKKSDRDILVRIHIKKDGRTAGYLSQRNSSADFPVIACAVAKKEQSFYVAVGARPGRAELVVIDKYMSATAGCSNAADCIEAADRLESADHLEAATRIELTDHIEAAARAAAVQFSFYDNMRASANYRRHLAFVYVNRLMEQISELNQGQDFSPEYITDEAASGNAEVNEDAD